MLPMATTTIRVMKPSAEQEIGEPSFSGSNAQLVEAAKGIRAVFSRPLGSENRNGGEQATTVFILYCDLFDGELSYKDGVIDEVTGSKYEIASVPFKRVGAGADHWVAEVSQVEGLR